MTEKGGPIKAILQRGFPPTREPVFLQKTEAKGTGWNRFNPTVSVANEDDHEPDGTECVVISSILET